MSHGFVRALAIAGALGCTSMAHAYHFEVHWVQRVGNSDIEIPGNVLLGAPGQAIRVRLQFGVFDDAAGPATAGGYWGWNVGTLVDSAPAAGQNTRTPGRLAPFVFPPFPSSNGVPAADPWTSLTQIDNTRGPQDFPWLGVPGTNMPGPQTPATIYARNGYVSTFEFTTIPGNIQTFTITAGGNLITVNEWRQSPATTPPDPGDDGIFGPGDFNGDGVDDGADDTPGLVDWVPLTPPPVPFQSVLTVVVPAPGAAGLVLAAGALALRRSRRASCK